jgi:hypothetical protein
MAVNPNFDPVTGAALPCIRGIMNEKNLKPFAPGQSGNPFGRPKSSRHKISEAFIKALCEDFEEHGVAVIATVRSEHPAEYLRVVASLMPKQVAVVSSPFDGISDEQLGLLVQIATDALSTHDVGLASH